jgi:DNA-binding CsgD family transcriptional regulator
MGQPSESQPEDPAPPYHLVADPFIFLGLRLDPGFVQALVPVGLVPTPECSGILAICAMKQGWGPAPGTLTAVGIAVEGWDGPDGRPAHVLVEAWLSGRTARLLPRHYGYPFTAGETRLWRDGARCGFVTTAADGAVVMQGSFQDIDSGPAELVSGQCGYFCDDGQGLRAFGVTFSTVVSTTVCDSLVPGPAASPLLRGVDAASVLWATGDDWAQLAWGAPRFVTSAAEAAGQTDRATAVLDMFERLGQAAVLAGPDGVVMSANGRARGLLGAGPPGRAPRLPKLAHAGGNTTPGRRLAPSEVVRLESGQMVVAQGVPVSAEIAGQSALLVLLRDPFAPVARGLADTVLQMLGLTPAEARIAATVGGGQSVAEAALSLGLTENTVRSALKPIFGKLGLSRQAQLAALVARLG